MPCLCLEKMNDLIPRQSHFGPILFPYLVRTWLFSATLCCLRTTNATTPYYFQENYSILSSYCDTRLTVPRHVHLPKPFSHWQCQVTSANLPLLNPTYFSLKFYQYVPKLSAAFSNYQKVSSESLMGRDLYGRAVELLVALPDGGGDWCPHVWSLQHFS